jgi:hypothetical protein
MKERPEQETSMPTFNKQLTMRLLYFAVRLAKEIDALVGALVALDQYG